MCTCSPSAEACQWLKRGNVDVNGMTSAKKLFGSGLAEVLSLHGALHVPFGDQGPLEVTPKPVIALHSPEITHKRNCTTECVSVLWPVKVRN